MVVKTQKKLSALPSVFLTHIIALISGLASESVTGNSLYRSLLCPLKSNKLQNLKKKKKSLDSFYLAG